MGVVVSKSSELIERPFVYSFVVVLAALPWVGLVPLYALWVNALSYAEHCSVVYGVQASMHDPKIYGAYPFVEACLLFAGMMWPFSLLSMGCLFYFHRNVVANRRWSGLVLLLAFAGHLLAVANLFYAGYSGRHPIGALFWFMD